MAKKNIPATNTPLLSPATAAEPANFELSLKELEDLVARMEQGGISLEESLVCFERGITLTRTCQQALKDAEQKIQILVEKDGRVELQSFDNAG